MKYIFLENDECDFFLNCEKLPVSVMIVNIVMYRVWQENIKLKLEN